MSSTSRAVVRGQGARDERSLRSQPKGEVANSLLARRDRGEGANRLHDDVHVLNLTVGVDPLRGGGGLRATVW
jgi:hypothetical protein